MSVAMSPVKHPDSNARSRRERARATRLRITKAAYVLFCERGYAGTTMAEIADAAGVAVQTVYFTFHTKGEVLASTYELAVHGEGEPAPPEQQPWYRSAVAEPDLAAAVGLVVDGAGEIVRRVAPLDLAVRAAAASDPDAQRLLDHSERLRVDGYRAMIELLRAKSSLRPGLSPERATQVLLFLVSPSAYRTLVLDLGWSHVEWVAWTATVLVEQAFVARGQVAGANSTG